MSKDKVKVLHYKNCVVYKLNNRRITVYKHAKGDKESDGVVFYFRRLITFENEEDKKRVAGYNNALGTKLIFRPWSKHCVWLNSHSYSMEAFQCIVHFYELMSEIDTLERNKEDTSN